MRTPRYLPRLPERVRLPPPLSAAPAFPAVQTTCNNICAWSCAHEQPVEPEPAEPLLPPADVVAPLAVVTRGGDDEPHPFASPASRPSGSSSTRLLAVCEPATLLRPRVGRAA